MLPIPSQVLGRDPQTTALTAAAAAASTAAEVLWGSTIPGQTNP